MVKETMQKALVNILVVEDSPTQLESLKFLLEDAGFAVIAAANGKEGLRTARANAIDLVITDIVMPEMDGYELCAALRTADDLKHLPIILLTSLTDPKDVIRGLESGANNFICKPYDDQTLLARVQNVIANQEIRKAATSEMGISIFFAGQKFFITADRLQILDLLLSTYENAVSNNNELLRTRDELRIMNEQLEARVAERTAELTAEIKERKRAEDAIKQNESRLKTLVNILQHPSESIHEFLDYALGQAIQMTGSSIGFLFNYNDERRELTLNTWSKGVMAECSIAKPKICYDLDETGIWGEAIRKRRPVLVNDFAAGKLAKKGFPEGHVEIFNFMAVPILKNEILVGVVGLGNKETDYDNADILQISLLLEAVWKVVEHKNAEDEQEKLQTQLNQAQKMESVGRLAGGVAHDFNNMLGVILGHTEMALEQVSDTQTIFENLTEIRKAAERSANLTRQLLAFARKQTIAPRVLDLNETVGGMLKMLRRLIGEDTNFEWLSGTNLWNINMDPSQIDQILANLCVNARDAITGIGTVTIETDTATFVEADCNGRPGFSPGDYVVLAVSDDGCGMDMATRAKLFEPFFTTKETGKGTGLGLATVYGIVKQNKGFINVYSEPGKGTTFKIYLPRHTGEDVFVKQESTAELDAQGQETILLVEDESAILNITKIMLKKKGYAVLAANSPGEAIHLAEKFAGGIDLLITDVVMPEMNGQDLAEQLKALHPELKLLFMSGYTANVIAHRGVLDDGVNFIQKPFSIKDLAAKVRELLDKV